MTLAMLLAGCAAAVRGPALPSPAEIPALEAHLDREPTDVSALVRLGVAYREGGRLAEARTTLERALQLSPTDPAAVVYLGLTYEDLQLPGEARALYTRYLEVGRHASVRSAVQGRLPVLERQELQIAARDAVAREAELANQPPQPRTVAVFPFLYRGQDARYEPLGRAVAEMMVTDLSQTDRLTVLERTRVQLLIDEVQLSETALVDSATAVRGGRLLGAERIVQGQMDGDEALLRMQAAVVGLSGVWDGRPLVEQDPLRQLFDMQKRLVLNLYTSLGIELTPAERERVTQRPTENLEALLAYGECLQAEDAGDFAAAAAHCARAIAIDPAFVAAQQAMTRTGDAAVALQFATTQLGILASPELGGAGDLAVIDALDAIQVLVPGDGSRDAAAEVLGREGIGRTTTIDIILRRP